jgi:hypothetical protein
MASEFVVATVTRTLQLKTDAATVVTTENLATEDLGPIAYHVIPMFMFYTRDDD